MATLQLNLQLTDEQYQSLMDNSFDTVINGEETITALREIIVAQMADYLKSPSGRELIEKQFNKYGYFGYKEGPNPMTVQIVNDAAAKTVEMVTEAVTGYMMDVAKTQNLEAIIQSILAKAVLEGAVSGLENWRQGICETLFHIEGDVRDVRSRLGIND